MSLSTDLDWQEQASRLPERFLKVIDSGLDTGAMSLSPAHVQLLNEYSVYVRGLPISPIELVRWLNPSISSRDTHLLLNGLARNSEFGVDSVLGLVRKLQGHAFRWHVLFGKNIQLAVALVKVSTEINSAGSVIMAVTEQAKALGKRREDWSVLQVDRAVLLCQADREIVSRLPEHMTILRELLVEYSAQVDQVRVDVNVFNDEARTQLIPEVMRQINEIDDRDSNVISLLHARLHENISYLLRRLQKIEALLGDVLTASSHFHSAWQSFSTYIDLSEEKLQQITTNQQLARFAIYFGQFLGLWSSIEERATEMHRKLSLLQP